MALGQFGFDLGRHLVGVRQQFLQFLVLGIDSPTHPEHLYERSDHFNYARKGIPIVFFTTGLHADYHAPSDDVSKIEFDKLARVSRLLLDAGLAVANAPARPR